MNRCLLLDTSSLAFRAFFALPTSISGPKGNPVNAVHGYLDMTSRLIGDRRPSRIVHVLDDEMVPAERAAAYPGYKAQRDPIPEEIPAQIELLVRVLGLFGTETAWSPGWEADDTIGALCASNRDGEEIDVVTGDRDLLQVVDNGPPPIRLLYTLRGVSELGVFDERGVRQKYGVPPSRYADFAILRGDPSDGLPGVAGVGEKTARSLVCEYETLDDLVAHHRDLTPRLGQRVAAAREYIDAMKKVVPVRTDVPVRTERPERDDAALDAVAEQEGLGGPIRRMRAALDGRPVPSR